MEVRYEAVRSYASWYGGIVLMHGPLMDIHLAELLIALVHSSRKNRMLSVTTCV